MTRDEALMILNDHIGQHVEVSVNVAMDLYTPWITSQAGVLGHWQPDPNAIWVPATPSFGEMAGVYTVGPEAGFNVSELPDARLLRGDDGEARSVEFELADNVTLAVRLGRGA